MICLETNPTTGALRIKNPQPSDISTCSLVAGNYSESVSEVWQLTPAQGAEIAGAILLVWAIAWVFRVLARSLNIDSERNEP